MDALRRACDSSENLMPFIIDAAREYATLQEIMDVFRQEFGIYTEREII
jgi:methylmalonyl-CoA mutase N-terminal domain/subunit